VGTILQVAEIKKADDGQEEGEDGQDEGYWIGQKCKHVLVDCGEDDLVLMKVWNWSADSEQQPLYFKSELQPRVCAALILACKCTRCRKNITDSSSLISPDLKLSR
jgi:hypothetical protein